MTCMCAGRDFMHSWLASAVVLLLGWPVRCNRPAFLPASVPDPLAYYFIDEGQGFALKDFVSSDPAAGTVIYDKDHQTVAYTQPNWMDDEFFGTVIQCGKKDMEQKDTLQLADVNYGHKGQWSLSLWFRHDSENFDGHQREQLIGHGDPLQPTPSANQFHVQLEKSNMIRTIVYEISSDTLMLPDAYDTNWHQYLFTANPSYASGGYFVYIDGVQQDAGITKSGSFDPVGAFRLCGRLKPAQWSGGSPPETCPGPENCTRWDPRRYFLGKVAHFSVWDSAMTPEQAKELHSVYFATYPKHAEANPNRDHDQVSAAAGFVPTGILLVACAVTFLSA